ncbi:PEP-CTERM sorting domain-containing protein [Akkermansiaceae bacterium]|nr:PEP-CTERM sorting domain-containing protein [Akkermansiaceae bacterium]MDB4668211.1 PEP-CTERM sorting domain-containing protein [Akkermansiaceae bacterium]MDB4781931.1 PEP-CTERM sorting domain-containing protein [Akkermansiaceae bacterium]
MQFSTLILSSYAILSSLAGGATIIGLTGDAANSSAPGYGSAIAGTTNDAFVYDPLAPLSATPDLSFSIARAFHGEEPNSGDITLTYTTNHIISASDTFVVFDIWGRSDGTRNRWQDRDNDFDVEIFDAAGSLGSVTGLAITDGPNPPTIQHTRVSFGSIPVGTTITQLVITARDTVNAGAAGDINNFTVQEVRLAAIAIPEPSSLLLTGLAALGFLGRRRR